jgi:hypothetical protein
MVEVQNATKMTQNGRVLVFCDVVLLPFHSSVLLKKNINTFKIRTGALCSLERLLYRPANTHTHTPFFFFFFFFAMHLYDSAHVLIRQ